MEMSTMQGLMQGKRGLIMGIANDHSIAWGIAQALAAQGATMAFTYQGDALGKRVKPLAEQLKVDTVLPCDVEDIASVDAVFEALRAKWGGLDVRSEEHTSELQSLRHLVCRLLLEKKKKNIIENYYTR